MFVGSLVNTIATEKSRFGKALYKQPGMKRDQSVGSGSIHVLGDGSSRRITANGS